MKLTTLKNALAAYMLTETTTEEKNEIIKALMEVHAAAEYMDNEVLPSDEVSIITAFAVSDLLNCLTYDIYGKLRRVYDDVPFRNYAHECRKLCGLENFTNAQLQIGFDFIGDLWLDNEHMGANNPDGSFNKGNDGIYDTLLQIKKALHNHYTNPNNFPGSADAAIEMMSNVIDRLLNIPDLGPKIETPLQKIYETLLGIKDTLQAAIAEPETYVSNTHDAVELLATIIPLIDDMTEGIDAK